MGTLQYTSYGRPRADLGAALYEFNPRQKFVTTDVLPILGVPKKSAALPVIRRENLKLPSVDHADGSAFNRVNLYTEDANYTCASKGLEAPLTKADRELYRNDFDAEEALTLDLMYKILLRQELRAKTALFNTSTWTGAALYTDNSASPWDTAATDIIAQVRAAIDKVRINTGFRPNAMLIGALTLTNMINNTGIKARFPGATVITLDMILSNLAAIFGLQELVVGEAIYDTALEGVTFVGGEIWPDDYALIYVKQQGLPNSGGLGRTIIWEPMAAENVVVDQYYEDQTKSDVFRVEQWVEEKIFDPYFGHLLKIDA